MRSVSLAALLAIALALPLSAETRTYAIAQDGRSNAGFRIDDTIETVDGSTTKVSGNISLDPAKTGEASVVMSVDLASLDTGLRMRDADMRETLATSKYPAAVFKSTAVIGPAAIAVGAPVDLKLAGDFTIHGVTHRINVPVRVTLVAPDRLQASGKFTIRMTDYDIPVPDKLIVSVANEVLVRFAVVATAK